jgi:hypothetical protein
VTLAVTAVEYILRASRELRPFIINPQYFSCRSNGKKTSRLFLHQTFHFCRQSSCRNQHAFSYIGEVCGETTLTLYIHVSTWGRRADQTLYEFLYIELYINYPMSKSQIKMLDNSHLLQFAF